MTTPKRISNRKYPPKDCRECGESFIPTDARQDFCIPQHRIDYHNDLRKAKAAPVKSLTDGLLQNEKILKKVFKSLSSYQQATVHIDLLKYEKFDFNISSSIDRNEKNGAITQWSFSYGIEGYDADKTTFIIRKK